MKASASYKNLFNMEGRVPEIVKNYTPKANSTHDQPDAAETEEYER